MLVATSDEPLQTVAFQGLFSCTIRHNAIRPVVWPRHGATPASDKLPANLAGFQCVVPAVLCHIYREIYMYVFKAKGLANQSFSQTEANVIFCCTFIAVGVGVRPNRSCLRLYYKYSVYLVVKYLLVVTTVLYSGGQLQLVTGG